MDRSSSLSSNFRTLGTSHTPYEKLTLRLTPKIIDSKGVIRIPTKSTPTANPITSDNYSQIRRNDWMDIVSPSR